MEDQIVIVNEQNIPIKLLPKIQVHNTNTPLHRAFSVFIFNKKGDLLLQQRSKEKSTWPLVWSNSCCGHQKIDEDIITTVKKRIKLELGIKKIDIFEVEKNFKYRAEKDGIVEHEICPIFIGFTENKVKINPKEVKDYLWISWVEFLEMAKESPESLTPWCILERELLQQNETFKNLYTTHTTSFI